MRTIIGVMGGAVASEETTQAAFDVGRLIAENGWVLLNGGRDAGVMEASTRGAHQAGGMVVGILPTDNVAGCAPVDIAIPTGMGDGRNIINVNASRVVIALTGGAGTVSEIALALKAGKPVITLNFPLGVPFTTYYERGQLYDVSSAEEAIEIVVRLLGEEHR